jgi:hypothetical protein
MEELNKLDKFISYVSEDCAGKTRTRFQHLIDFEGISAAGNAIFAYVKFAGKADATAH